MRRKAHAPERLLSTVLFTDIVGSTERAAELGDKQWRRLISVHHALVRRELKRYKGREVDTAGDGFFSTFDQPAQAIECAEAVVQAVGHLGIEVRAGIHIGEVEVTGPKVSGIAVHIGARVMAKAAPGQVLVSSTVHDLMSGSDIKFKDLGEQELKGVPAHWHLYAVERPTEATAAEAPVIVEEHARRRLPLIPTLIIAAVLMTVVAALAIALFSGGSSAAFTPSPNTVARIDPASGKVVDGAAVDTMPTSIAYGEGSVWVGNFESHTVQPVDPTTNEAGSAIGLDGNPTGIAVGGGSVWVTSSISGQLYQIDPSTNAARRIPTDTGVTGVAYGEDAVWVTNGQRDAVLRFDPSAPTDPPQSIQLAEGSQPAGIAVGAGSIWVAESLKGAVVRIDPKTMEVIQTILVLSGQPNKLAFGEGYVWVTNTDDDSLTRIDPVTNRGTTIKVGNGPTGVATSPGAVWVVNSLDGTVSEIDTKSSTIVATVKLGYSPDGVTTSPGAVWVTIHSL